MRSKISLVGRCSRCSPASASPPPRAPTTTIPAKGNFTLEEATKGLSGCGPAHRQDRDDAGDLHLRALRQAGARSRWRTSSAWRAACAPGRTPRRGKWVKKPLLRRPHLPPRHPRLHDPGRRSAGHGHRQPGLPLRGRVLARPQVRQAGSARHGQRRARHQRLAVLHHRGDARSTSPAGTPSSASAIRCRWSPRSPASSAARATSRSPTS